MALIRPTFRFLGALPGTAYAHAAAAFWGFRGRRALSRGQTALGVKALEQAVSWRPNGFKPLLRLAAGYLKVDEIWAAHRALALVRETAPARFSRSGAVWMARQGVDPSVLAQILASASLPQKEESKVPLGARAMSAGREVGTTSLPFGDCGSLDEYARFVAMPRITRDEIEDTDWDRLLEDLLED